MLEQNKQIFVSFHPDEKHLVDPALEQMRAAGWKNIKTAGDCVGDVDIPQLIKQSDMFIVFLSRQYAQNDVLMLEEFSYSSVIERKHFIPVWLDKLDIIQKEFTGDAQLLSALEMLTAKYTGVDLDGLIGALTDFKPFEPKYKPSEPQLCEKPCEAYEGDEPYIFISYAHDNAPDVYPHVEALYEAGWDLWYDEGIKTTQRYLPVIADAIKRCTVFVLMLTERCLERPFVMNYELEYARKLNLQRGITIVPVLLEDVPGWDGEEAIKKEALLKYIGSLECLREYNRGKRDATPPAVRQNVVYDVVLPPKIPGFEIAVQGYEFTITKYVGGETGVYLPGKIQIGMTVFKVTSIGNRAFDRCSSLSYVKIPYSVTSIGDSAFAGCSSLTSVTIPDSVTSIGGGAFGGCISLTSITIPDSIISIGGGAFGGCISLTSITIPDSIIYIAQNAFKGCPVYIPGRGSLDDIKKPQAEVDSADKNDNDSKEKKQTEKDNNKIPSCGDKPYALICCAEEDIQRVKPLLIELYWEGFNLLYDKSSDNSMINESGCILAFFTEKTSESKETIALLNGAIDSDSAKIIQIILTGADWPDEVKNKLNDKKAIIQKECTEREFTGLIRDSLRRFECALGHPRGFDVRNISGGVEVVRFHPTEYPEVVIPETFFDPPLPVVSIGERAFGGCSSLTSITIPDSVTSIGSSAFEYCSSLTSVTIPDSVTSIGSSAFCECNSLSSVTIPDSVTSIDNYAFCRCSSLSSITIPDSVTSIGYHAFEGCSSLTSITIPDGVTSIGDEAFEGCSSLSSVTIPDGVTSIGGGAFWGCRSLSSVTIPDAVTYIGKSAFYGCSSLADISVNEKNDNYSSKDGVLFNKDMTTLLRYPEGKNKQCYEIPDSVTSIGGGAFRDCISLTSVTIPDSVTSIGDYAFSGCNSLSSVTIPDSVTSIGDYAFSGCNSLSSVTIPDSVTNIGDYAFSGCNSLSSVTIPDSVTSIDNYAFCRCSSLSSITIPDSVTSIGYHAFEGCSSLTSITIPDGVTSIGDEAFEGCSSLSSVTIPDGVTSIGKSAFCRCSSLSSVTIPDSVTSIGDYAFRRCSSLSSVTIPDGVTSIGDDAFSGCSALTSITIPDSVTSIGYHAFEGCSSLTSITIPDGVTSIGGSAFEGCSSLSSVTIPDGVTSIGDYAFSDCSSLSSVTIPDGVTSIGGLAFYYCSSLSSVTIPDSVKSIGGGAFRECRSLADISVNKKNDNYSSKDGVLLNKNMTTLLCYPGGKNKQCYEIPDGVTRIGNDAFSWCSSLSSVTIPDSVTSIGKYAFRGCSSLTIYTPPNSVAWRYAKENGIKREPLPEPKPPLKPSIFSRIFKRKK